MQSIAYARDQHETIHLPCYITQGLDQKKGREQVPCMPVEESNFHTEDLFETGRSLPAVLVCWTIPEGITTL